MTPIRAAVAGAASVVVIGYPHIPDTAIRISHRLVVRIDITMAVLALPNHAGLVTGFRLRRREDKDRSKNREDGEQFFHVIRRG